MLENITSHVTSNERFFIYLIASGLHLSLAGAVFYVLGIYDDYLNHSQFSEQYSILHKVKFVFLSFLFIFNVFWFFHYLIILFKI